LLFAFAQAVHANFAQDERFGFGQHLQARQIILERPLLMQINVETKEIEILRVQKLRGRIIAEGAEALGIHGFGHVRQLVQKILTAPAPLQRTMSGGSSLTTL
jgi:hypothetical protein